MRAYGGDRVDEGEGGRVSLISSSSKGWRGRSPAIASRRSAHPGTAVSWDGALYEVTDARPLTSGEVLYSLAPWDEAQAIRTLERYDAPNEEARSRERIGRAGAVKRRRAAILLSPLLGHLPGEVQERMESEFGAPANKMTVVSALPTVFRARVPARLTGARLQVSWQVLWPGGICGRGSRRRCRGRW